MQAIHRRAIEAVVEIGKEIEPYFGRPEEVSYKSAGTYDAVTELDRRTEEYLKGVLYELDPSVTFFGEETGGTESSRMWLLDPIDGTVHFIRGVPFATTMLALIEEGEVVFSVINNFVTHEVFVAIRGGGATRNGEVIRVSDHALARSFLSFESDTRKEENLRLYQALRARGAMVTNTVNCGFEMSMIASGKWDGRIMRDPFGKVWDFAPGSLLIAEAGGVVTNIGKNSYDYHNLNSLMTNRRIHEELTSGDEALFP